MSGISHITDRARVPPEQMTLRARLYLTIAATSHLAVGLATFVAADKFTSTSFYFIRSILPLWAWGIVFCGAGLVCLASAVVGNELLARVGLIMSATSSAFWTGGFIAATIFGYSSSPTGVIAWGALTLKDLVQCEQPMRSPFEPLIRQVLNRRASDRSER